MRGNTISMIARAAKDPELRFSQDGKAWAKVRVGVDARFKKDGEYVNEVIWATAKVFGPMAEYVAEHVSKGTRVLIVGSFQPANWTNKEGVEVNDLEIMVDEIGLDLRFGVDANAPRPAAPDRSGEPF